jgi:hypothetical protein
MEPEHATALGYYLKEGAVAGLLQKETPATITHIARAGGWRGTAEGLKRSPEERIKDIGNAVDSAEHPTREQMEEFSSKKNKIEHDINEYHRIGAINEKKKKDHISRLNFWRGLAAIKAHGKFSYGPEPLTVASLPPQPPRETLGGEASASKQPENPKPPETGQNESEDDENGPFSEFTRNVLGS